MKTYLLIHISFESNTLSRRIASGAENRLINCIALGYDTMSTLSALARSVESELGTESSC